MYCLCRSSKTISLRIIFLDDADFLYEIQVSDPTPSPPLFILNYYNFPFECYYCFLLSHTHWSAMWKNARTSKKNPFLFHFKLIINDSTWNNKICRLTQYACIVILLVVKRSVNENFYYNLNYFLSLSLFHIKLYFPCDTLHQWHLLLKEWEIHRIKIAATAWGCKSFSLSLSLSRLTRNMRRQICLCVCWHESSF